MNTLHCSHHVCWSETALARPGINHCTWGLLGAPHTGKPSLAVSQNSVILLAVVWVRGGVGCGYEGGRREVFVVMAPTDLAAS